jgi:hypothetical protein
MEPEYLNIISSDHTRSVLAKEDWIRMALPMPDASAAQADQLDRVVTTGSEQFMVVVTLELGQRPIV